MRRRRLGVNIDHVATLRQARGTLYPQPLEAAYVAQRAGADQITVHLREDRRHIQDDDVLALRRTVETALNLEMAATEAMLALALRVRPDVVTLVPEKRAELTTEGGLDVVAARQGVGATVQRLQEGGIPSSLFIDPDAAQVRQAQALGATAVELHTGCFAEAPGPAARQAEVARLAEAAHLAQGLGLRVACGHGLHYHNVDALLFIDPIEEYNIGHSIVAQAVFSGLERAVRDMLERLNPHA